MKKIVLAMLILLLIVSCVVGCVANLDDGKNSNTSLAPSIPSDFTFGKSRYTICYDKIDVNSFTVLVGYLINAEDLEKWKNIDNNENLIYVLNEHNNYDRFSDEDDNLLRNRYELFSRENDDKYLVINWFGIDYKVYEKTQEKIGVK